MTDWPKVCVLLLTYDRLEYAERTLRGALDRLVYPEPLSVHIADDGSAPGYVERLCEIAGGYTNVQGITMSGSQRGGYGASYNLATQVIHDFAEIVLPLEDDWELARPLDLAPLVGALREGIFGCIRLGYLGFTQPLRGELVIANGLIWLLLDPESPEPHVFAGHPRLETVAWEKATGPWPEGYDPNTTEFVVCHNPAARQGVVWPINLLTSSGGLFAHIGTLQARADQRQAVEA